MYPRLFQFGPVALPTYGVFAALALIAGLTMAMRAAARLRVSPGAVWNFGLIAIFSAALSSRVLLLAGHWHDFLAYPLLMLSITAPRTVDSVLIELGIGLFAGLLYLTLKRMSWLSTLDAAAPGWALGQAILMLGCFLAGCDFGHPTSMPWGVAFHSRWASLWNGTPLGVRLHPVQLYLCALDLALFAALLWWLPRRRQPGELAGAWLLIYGLGEFFLDFFRGNNRLLIFAGALSLTQAIDFAMVVLGCLLLLERKQAHQTAEARA